MRWCQGFPPVTIAVECGGAEHRVTWRRGKLVLEDHAITAEEALIALGGEPPVCLEIVEAWRRATEDASILVVLANSPAPKETDWGRLRAEYQAMFTTIAVQTARAQAQVVSARISAGLPSGAASVQVAVGSGAGRAQPPSRQRLDSWRHTLLTSLPRELRTILIACLVIACDRRWKEIPHFSEYLIDEVVQNRARLAIEESIQSWSPPGTSSRISLWEVGLLPRGKRPAINAERLPRGYTLVSVALPVSWLAEVWARGVSVVDGCFILEVSEAEEDGQHLRARAVRWQRADRDTFVPVEAPAGLARVDGVWRLWWRS